MIATKNMFNSAVFPITRPSHYAPPDYYTQVVDGILYRYDNNDWDYCQIISLSEVTPGFSYAHACGDSQLPQIRVVRPRPIPVRDAPLRPSDAEEAACYRRAQAMTRSKRVYKFVYGQQRLFIDGVPCQGPLTRSQARKKRVFSLNKIFERKAAVKEQLRLERFERLWGKSAYSFLKSLGYKKVYIAPYVPFPALPTSVKQVKNCTRKSAIDDSLKGTFISTPQAIRDSELALKLRQLIKSFRPTLTKRSINTISLRDCVKLCYVPRATGQMDQGAHGTEDSVESVKVSNTVITTHNEESVGAAEPTVLNWHSLTTTDPEQEYVFGTERWCIYKVLPWNKNTETSGNLDEISMPTDLMKQCWNQPAMAVFKNNRYWRSDIEFRFQLNTNKFQSGSLQCSYIYDCDKDASLVYRANVYGLSQTNHCILDASGSNMGTLYIPYKYNNPYLNTDNDKEYVKVFIKVLNHLECPSTVYGSASLTVYYRFVNAKFMGTLDTSLVVRPQMLTLMRALGAAAEAGLRSVNKDLNRDKPPEPSAPLPTTLRSTSSWCIGTNLVEPTNLLRLDSSGQTPHPNLKLSSMLVKDLVNIYGLVLCDQKWNTEDEVGHLLQRLDAAPLWKLDNYGAVGLDWPVYPSADTAYALPPLAVVSSMFTYWRGTMDLRIDIVGTPFHKGQLLISYIPRNHLMDEVKNQVTLEMAKSSNYTICDLSETRSFTINIPYISSRPMYPLKYSRKSGNDIPPPGYLSIFVLNPLIPMDNVSKFVYINYYLKAGKDFELLVPRQPSIGLPYDPSYKPEPSNIVTTNKPVKPKNKVGLLPFDYTDSKTILYVSGNMDSYQGNIITDNYTMDFAIRVPARPWFTTDTFVLRLINPVQSNLIKDRGIVVFKYCGLIERSDNIYVLVPIEKDFIKMYSINNKNKIFTGLITMSEWCSYYNVDGSYADTNLWAKTHLSIYDDYVLKVPAPTVKSRAWLNAAPEMDERVLDTDIVTPMSGSLLSTSSGLTILGENFSDLKNLCRRYQKLFNQIIMLDNSRTDKLSVCFPVSPMGIINNSQNFDSTIPEVFNRCRDGIIPLITSGYRYWRGSMRFRIMTDNKVDLNIIVQHRPDVTSSLYNITQITDNVDRNSYLNHGYSMVIQNLSVNNCVDIEVPWYNPNMLASCHQPNSNDDLNNKYSLGSIFIGFNNNSGVKSVGLSVYYSIGDDFRFDSFQGFPCMVSVNKVAIAQPQMFSTIKGWINLPSEIKKANQTAENFNDHVLPKIKKTLQNEVKDSLINVYEILCDLASQLVHCMINPNIKTILWSIFSVFVKFGLLTIKCATKLVQLGIKILGFTVGAVCSPIKKSAFGKRFAFNGKHLYYRGVCLPQECCYNIPKAVRLLKYIDKHETRGIPVCCTKPIDPKDTGFAYDLALDKELLKAKLEVNKDNEVLGSVKRPEVPLPDELVDQLAKEYPQILNPFFGEEDDEEDLEVPSSTSNERASVQNGEDAEEVAASMVSIIYSSICVLLNFTCTEKKDFKSFVPVLMKGMGTTASGANNIFRFIKNNFKLFNILYEKVMYNKYWALKRYRILETEDMDLNKWANSVSVLLQPKFRTFIDNKQLWRDAVFGAARYGFLYLTENTKNPQKNTAIDPFIRKLYEQIVRLRDELQTQKLFPSLRQEAFSMWIFGPAGVGKSTLVDDLTTRMLKAISFTHINELKYTISPVTKHWDGCNQQPVIVIDDAFAVDEPEANAAQLWAYFQICSPIPLRPPMAKLEDKSMTYNPEIFVSCANTAFPRITMLRTEEALFRRRHLLIETRLNPDTTTKPDYPFGLSADQVANYEHIQFRLAVTPRSRQTQYMAWMDFNSLVNYCIDKFKEFKIKSKITYEARHALHYSLYPTDLDIPEEATLRSLYTKDNEERKAGSEQVCDTFGITLADTKATLKEVGESIKQLPSDPANPVHPSISAQAMDLAFKSLEECSIPLSLSEVLNMGKHAETNTAQQQMKDVQTLTQYMGLGLRQADLCSKVLPDVDQKRLMLMECDEMIKESGTDDNETILLGASDDFTSFEETLKSKLGTFFDCNEDIATRFVVMPISKLNNAPKVNEQILGPPLLNKILEDNCLHMLLDRDTPMIKSDCGKYLSWLIEYDNRVFSIYDCPCKANNCVLKLPDNDSKYIKFVSFVYAWYSNNYNLIKNVHTKFVNNGGVNFLFLTHFSYIERYVLAQRNIVVNAIRRYKDLGLWKGYILPGAHWLGGWLKKIYSTLHTVLGICGMLSIGYFTYKMWNPTPVPTKAHRSKGQLISSGDSGTHNRPNNTRLIVSKKLGAKQQLNDHCLSSVIRRRIHNNTVYIEFTDNSTQRQAVMKCLIIKGRNMLVIKHYYDYLSTYTNENSECYLCWNDVGRIPFDYSQLTWNWFDDSNFGLVELPRTVSERKSLIPFIATEHQANTNISPNCDIIDINTDAMKIFSERVSYCGTVVIEPSRYSEELVMNGCWRYGRNYPGMCGSILMSTNLTTPIIGMHVAGGNGFGYSEPLTREMFSELDKQTDGPVHEYRELDLPIVPVEQRKVYLTGSHRYAGNIDADILKTDIKLAKVESGVSKIVPSLLYGTYPILTEPGPLTPKDPRLSPKFSPLVEGCEKMCNPTYEFDAVDVAQSEEDLLQKLLSCVKPLRLNVNPLTVEQALNGIPDLEGYDHINWDTSEGFPLSRIRPPGARNKRWLFEFNNQGKAIKIHDALQTILEDKMKDRMNGIVPVTLHDDCLKDARIPVEKINIPGKTRIFSISPVDFTIHFRQYYLDFIAAYGAARFKAEHAIGINVHGLEWTDLANLVGSDHMITGDYSGFGPTLNTEILHAAFRVIFKWYQYHDCSEQSHKIRYIMSREICNALHLMNDYVYQTSCGMPSGNPGTVIFNSLVNSLYIRCAYLKIMRRTLYSGLYCFNKYVTLVTYGDDLIAKLHPNIIEYFNFNSLSQFFFTKNLKFTDAAKTGIAVEPTMPLNKATFLKHCFNPHPFRNGIYLAGLDKVSITECVNWVRKSPDMKDATYQNCNQATMLSYGWGPEYFNDLVATIRKEWRDKFDEYFQCRTWEELDTLFLDENWDPNLKW